MESDCGTNVIFRGSFKALRQYDFTSTKTFGMHFRRPFDYEIVLSVWVEDRKVLINGYNSSIYSYLIFNAIIDGTVKPDVRFVARIDDRDVVEYHEDIHSPDVIYRVPLERARQRIKDGVEGADEARSIVYKAMVKMGDKQKVFIVGQDFIDFIVMAHNMKWIDYTVPSE